MQLAILGFLSAVLLSVRFDVLILLPAILLGWCLAVIGGVLGGGSFGSILFDMMLVAAALQVGYVAGIVGQWMMRSRHALPVQRPENALPVRWPDKSAATAPDKAF